MKNLKRALALITATATVAASTSAFASSTDSKAAFAATDPIAVSFANNTVTATVDVTAATNKVTANTQATFLILDKDATPANLAATDIVYLDQKEITSSDSSFYGIINTARITGATDSTIPFGEYPIKLGYYDQNGEFAIANGSLSVQELYAVSFKNEDGTQIANASGNYLSGATISEPAAPTKEHHTFAGWATEQGGTVAYTAGNIPAAAADATYYAVFNENPKYSVTFMNGAVVYGEEVSYYEGEDIIAPATNPTSTVAHKSFAGWSATDGGDVVELGKMGTSAKVFYAKYVDEATYTATFIANGTTFASPTFYAGETIVAPSPAPTKDNYTFKWWSLTEDGAEVATLGTMTSAGATFYAVFQENTKYTITFMNGDTQVSTASLYEGETITAPADQEKAGYTFLGWATDSAATEAETVDATASQDRTYYAIFEEEAPSGVTVTFTLGDVNGKDGCDLSDALAVVTWLGGGNPSVGGAYSLGTNVTDINSKVYTFGDVNGKDGCDLSDALGIVTWLGGGSHSLGATDGNSQAVSINAVMSFVVDSTN